MPKLNYPWIDYDSQYNIVMTPEHHMRQLGRSFIWEYRHLTPINVGASIYIEIITPSTSQITELAWRPSVVSSDQLFLSEFLGGPTVTDGTTSALIVNQNRNSTIAPTTRIFTDPTGISGGTLLRSRYTGTGTNAKPVGIGTDTSELGWTLKPNTKHIIKYTNVGQQATTFFMINGQFFEIVRDPNW